VRALQPCSAISALPPISAVAVTQSGSSVKKCGANGVEHFSAVYDRVGKKHNARVRQRFMQCIKLLLALDN